MEEENKVFCFSCGIELVPLYPGEGEQPSRYQLKDALWIGFFGGYGMYVDEIAEWGTIAYHKVLPGNPDFEAVLCEQCADSFLSANPWVQKLFGGTSDGNGRARR